MPYNEILENFGLIALTIVFGAQVIDYFKIKTSAFFDYFLKFVWIFSLAAVFGFEFYLVVLQYIDLSKDIFGRLLSQNSAYLFSYVLPRLVYPSVIALLAAILFWRCAKFLNARSGGRFFEKEELSIFGLAIFLTGYPAFFIYFIALIAVFLIFNSALSLYHILAKKTSVKNLPRFSLYFFWLPAAIFAIIIKSWLSSKGLLLFFNL